MADGSLSDVLAQKELELARLREESLRQLEQQASGSLD